MSEQPGVLAENVKTTTVDNVFRHRLTSHNFSLTACDSIRPTRRSQHLQECSDPYTGTVFVVLIFDLLTPK